MKLIICLILTSYIIAADNTKSNKAYNYLKNKDYKKASTILESICDKEHPSQCNILGKLYCSGGYGLRQDTKKCLDYRSFACRHGLTYICKDVAYMYLKNNDKSNGIKYLKKSCDSNDGEGCSLAGAILDSPIIGKHKLALRYFLKACNLNNADSCASLGSIYYTGKNVDRNYKKSFLYLSKACALGNSTSCAALGSIYYLGENTKKDYSKAIKYLSKACNLKNSVSCYIVGTIFYEKPPKNLNMNKAFIFFKKACKLGFKQSCKAYNYLLKNRDSNITTEGNTIYKQKESKGVQ